MMNKYRYHRILIIIMTHMESDLVWQIYSTLSSSAYLNVLQLIDFFQIISAQKNNYTKRNMAGRNSTLYLWHKLMNITVGEIIGLFVIILRTLIEPQKVGGYTSYFL